MELNKAASAVQSGLVTVWQAANEFTYDKFYLNMPAKMLSNLKLKGCISGMKYWREERHTSSRSDNNLFKSICQNNSTCIT